MRRSALYTNLFTSLLLPWLAWLCLGESTASAKSEFDAERALSRGALGDTDRNYAIRVYGEFGAISVVRHTIRYGDAGTPIDYRRDAAQDTLFRFRRFSGELEIARRHTILFVFQPLGFETEQVATRELRLGSVVFPQQTPMRFGYGFDFYRLAYQFDVFEDARRELAFGAGGQIRNARVGFFAADGSRTFTSTDLGFVPLLRMRARYTLESGVFVATEIDGIYLPLPWLEGDDTAVGALLDASVRTGLLVRRSVEMFVNVRYLGGGFSGPGSAVPALPEDDDWTENWLHTLSFSFGVGLR